MKTWSWETFRFGITGWRSAFFMLLWVVCNTGLFVLGYLEQKNDQSLARLNDPLGQSVAMSRGAGLVLMFHGMLIMLPVCRNILALLQRVPLLRHWVNFDKNIHFHKIVAWTMLAFTGVHTISHVINVRVIEVKGVRIMHDGNTAMELLWMHPAALTGVVMLFCMVMMYTTALGPIRRQSFELFWYTHHLALPFMLAFCLHAVGCFVQRGDKTCKPYKSWTVAIIGLGIYVLERILREVRSRQLTYISKVVRHPSDVVEIQIHKNSMTYLPGQYMFICVPDVSKYQWHPFTLTSAPEENYVSVHIRIVGDWTEAVAQRLGYYNEGVKLEPAELPAIRLDGPFGTPSQQATDYENVVFIGGGIGVTPFASLLKSIWYQRNWAEHSQAFPLRKIYFFWICRDTQSFEWFRSLLNTMEMDTGTGFLDINIYLTRGLNPDQVTNVYLSAADASDPITELRSHTRYGRPNFDASLRRIQDEHRARNKVEAKSSQGVHDVGVFLCGPEALKNTVRKACDRATNKEFEFHFHAEKF